MKEEESRCFGERSCVECEERGKKVKSVPKINEETEDVIMVCFGFASFLLLSAGQDGESIPVSPNFTYLILPYLPLP